MSALGESTVDVDLLRDLDHEVADGALDLRTRETGRQLERRTTARFVTGSSGAPPKGAGGFARRHNG